MLSEPYPVSVAADPDFVGAIIEIGLRSNHPVLIVPGPITHTDTV